MCPIRRRRLAPFALALLLVPCAAPASAQEPAHSPDAARLKQAHTRLVRRAAQRRLDQYRAAASATLNAWQRPASEPAGSPGTAIAPFRGQGAAGPVAIAPNRLVNNRSSDTAPLSGQSGVSIAAAGANLVAAWNDGEGLATGLSTLGFAYSTDGGDTWTDGGVPPVTGGVGKWTGDPVVAVNENTGAFYLTGLCVPTGTTNGIAVVKGTFTGGALVWQTPRVVVSGNNNSVLYDDQWLAVDSANGSLYLIYTRSSVSGGMVSTNRIDFQYTTQDNAAPWAAAATLSAAGDAGEVQGGRVAVGPNGEVWTVWVATAVASPFADFMRVRKVTFPGPTLGLQSTAATVFTNFGSGAPGSNRPEGFALPGIAVDRSNGPHRGRVYLIWNESINFYNDPLGGAGTVNESEPNNTAATADAFTQGQSLAGNLSTVSDVDYWSFSGTQGQTIICEVDAATAPNLNVEFLLFCTDQTTRLGFSETDLGGTGMIVFTLPKAGTYYLRAASLAGTGPYTVRTALNGAISERARDHRDVFTTYSDNGTAWSAPVRVNGDAPYLDNWLPEVAVSADGNVYALWYDWRDAPSAVCAGASMTYLSRSTDGGATWPDGSPVSDVLSSWTAVGSNIAPNHGDYTSLFANQNAVYACWADGRNNDPDVYMAAANLAFTPVQVSLVSTYAEPGLVRVTWHTAEGPGVTATVYRRTDASDWEAVGQVWPDGSGRMLFEDRAVVPGTRYHYRLGLRDGAGETFLGEVTVDVPLLVAPSLAIQQVHPNPARRHIWVSFTLAGREPATLELLDVLGRRVGARSVQGSGRQLLDLAAGLRVLPGVYQVRLTQAGRSAGARVSVVR